MSLRRQVFSIYRTLVRSADTLFGQDHITRLKARRAIKDEFRKNRDEKDIEKVRELIKVAIQADRVLRFGVLQGKLNKSGNYEVRFPPGFSDLEGNSGFPNFPMKAVKCS